MVSRPSRLLHTPTAEASSPAYRCTNPGISPVANSACTRSSNSRIARIIRYASSSCSRVRAFRSAVSVMCSSLTVDPRNWYWAEGHWYWAEGHCRSPEQALAGARREDRGDIDAPRTVRTQPDDGPLARLEGEFALAVDGDDARPRVDRVKG